MEKEKNNLQFIVAKSKWKMEMKRRKEEKSFNYCVNL